MNAVAAAAANAVHRCLWQFTRIILYTGHREIGLVLAGHYFQTKYLVVAVKPEQRHHII